MNVIRSRMRIKELEIPKPKESLRLNKTNYPPSHRIETRMATPTWRFKTIVVLLRKIQEGVKTPEDVIKDLRNMAHVGW